MAFDLDLSQHSAWEGFLAGKNVGLFGRAGCGKSTVLKRAIDRARSVHGEAGVGVVSWTTAAAKLIDGQTMHKFLRIGIAELPKERILEAVKRNKFVRHKVAHTSILFIDKVPLIPTRWFTIFEYVVRQLAPAGKQGRPWGGCQVVGMLSASCVGTRLGRRYRRMREAPIDAQVTTCRGCVSSGGRHILLLNVVLTHGTCFQRRLCAPAVRTVGGDPLQLRPVQTKSTRQDVPVYMCRIFRDSFLSRYGMLVFLTGSHRQSGDSWFVSCLDRVRKGEVTDQDLMVLNATSDGVAADEWDKRTQLRALNAQVDAFNNDQLSRLAGAQVVYSCRDEVAAHLTHPARRAYAQRCLREVAPPCVTLKRGAVVLSTREVDLVATATQGVVKDCREASVLCDFGGRLVDVKAAAFDVIDNCGTTLATRHAMPLALAWAMTIHRAQGTSLSTLAIDFCMLNWRLEGLVYAGLSRCRSLAGLFVRGLRRDHIVVDEDAVQFYCNAVEASTM